MAALILNLLFPSSQGSPRANVGLVEFLGVLTVPGWGQDSWERLLLPSGDFLPWVLLDQLCTSDWTCRGPAGLTSGVFFLPQESSSLSNQGGQSDPFENPILTLGWTLDQVKG